MKLDIPHDKALHVIGGSIIASVSSIAAAALLLIGEVFLSRFNIHIHPGAIPVLSLVLVLIAGIAKEKMDDNQNTKDLLAGKIPSHSVERADVVYTVIGGLLVTAPSFLFLTLFR